MKDFLIMKKFSDEYSEFGNAHMVNFINGDFTSRLDISEKMVLSVDILRFLNSDYLGEKFTCSVEECKIMMEKKLAKIEEMKKELNSKNPILSPESPKVKDMPETGSKMLKTQNCNHF